MNHGYIKLHRRLRDNPLWKDKPFTRGQAWIDLLLRANHKDNEVLFRNDIVKIERGELFVTERELAGAWGWGRTRVKTFLKLLENRTMIERKINPKANHITILNYSKYQGSRTKNEPQPNQKRTTAEPQPCLNNNVKNVKNNKNNTIYCSIPLIKRDGAFFVTEEMLNEYQDIFPGMEIKLAINYIKKWNEDNPNKRKTARGIKKHILRFLGSLNDQNKFRRSSQDDNKENGSGLSEFFKDILPSDVHE
jgi:hypothetical protein